MCYINENEKNAKNYDELFKKALEDDLQENLNARLPKYNLYEKIIEFFNYLFIDETDNKKINSRCFIIISRKGFSLWLAGVLCGIIPLSMCNPKIIISDRKWKKMSVKEKKNFVENKHVYIVDDSIITGASIQNIYFDIDKSAKSRNAVVFTSERLFDYSKMFESFKSFKEVSEEDRRNINEKILYALYKLAIPFSSESPIYHIKLNKKEFKNWNSLAEENGWLYDDSTLEFGVAATDNTFCFYAPNKNEEYGANILSRGVRMCTCEFNDSPEQIEVTLIPWIIFDVIDYYNAIDYLTELIEDISTNNDDESKIKEWLLSQLTEGDPIRKKSIVHRTISYLYDLSVMEEFNTIFLKGDYLSFYTLPNDVALGTYHFSDELLYGLNLIREKLNGNYSELAKKMFIDETKRIELANSLFGMPYRNLNIPQKGTPIKDLRAKLFAQREPKMEGDKYCLPNDSRRHPILCYSFQEKESVLIIVDLIRRAIGSLHSELISNKDGRTYLINTLFPGEGSTNVVIENYDFLYIFQNFCYDYNDFEWSEKEFIEAWNNYNADPKNNLSNLSDDMIKALNDETSLYWRDMYTIEANLKRTKPNILTNASEIMDKIKEKIIKNTSVTDENDPFKYFIEMDEKW